MGANFESTTFIHLRYLSDYIQINWHHSHGWARTPQGYLGVDDDVVDSMLDQINGTIDVQARIKLEQDAQRLILKRHGPTLMLYEPDGYWCRLRLHQGLHADRLRLWHVQVRLLDRQGVGPEKPNRSSEPAGAQRKYFSA